MLDEQEHEEDDGTEEDDEGGAERGGADPVSNDPQDPAQPAPNSNAMATDPAGETGGGAAEQGEEQGDEDRSGEHGGSSEDNEEDSDDAEIIDRINPNLRPDPRFFSERSMRTGSTEPRLLNKRMKRPESGPGFLVDGDERWYRNANSSCTTKGINSSASFKPNGRCHTCLSGEHDAWVGYNGQPVVIIAKDQHFPANLPVDGEGECIRSG
jgi:hypothetical protein